MAPTDAANDDAANDDATHDVRDLAYGVAGVLAVVVAVTIASAVFRGAALASGPATVARAYLPVWVPMLLAVALAVRGRSAGRLLGLRLGPLDVLWAIGGGFAARVVDAAVALGVTGSTGLVPAPTLGGAITPWFVVSVVLVPVVIAPFVEELLFRGLLQRSATRLLHRRMPRVPSAVVAVVATSVLFALLHVALTPSTTSAVLLVEFIGTFALGVAAGAIAAATGRIGGAILAHAVFNAVAVLLTWPA